jgi:hypothetical protein
VGEERSLCRSGAACLEENGGRDWKVGLAIESVEHAPPALLRSSCVVERFSFCLCLLAYAVITIDRIVFNVYMTSADDAENSHKLLFTF